jgi:chitinase
MKDLRSKFKASGRDLGLTFTAPSSYWYMRWFDLSGMLEHTDWMNFVSAKDNILRQTDELTSTDDI